MAMKESRSSLRLYFLLVALVSGFSNFSALTRGNNGIILPLVEVASLIIAIGFLLAGIFLDSLLSRSVYLLKCLLYFTLCVNLARGLILLWFNPVPTAFVAPIVRAFAKNV